MIFYLTDSLRGDAAYLESIRHELYNLAYSAYTGIHYLTGDLDILGDCIKLFETDGKISGFFRYLHENWYSMPIPECVSYYMEVVRDNPTTREENGKTIAQRQIKSFTKMESVSPCQLVCEDDSDCEFYKHIGEWYMNLHKINANIEFNIDGCGGCGFAKDKVRKHLLQNQLCLCILDSDKWYADKEENPNSVECRDYYKDQSDCCCIILNVRELENLIPLNYADEFTKTNPYYEYQRSKDYLRHFCYLRHSDKRDEILPYFDFKEGIRKDYNFVNDAKYRDFALLCWKQNPELNNGTDFDTYVKNVKDNLIYYPFARKVADHAISYIYDRKTEGNLKPPVLLPFQEDEWNRIGKEITTWGYARFADEVS